MSETINQKQREELLRILLNERFGDATRSQSTENNTQAK